MNKKLKALFQRFKKYVTQPSMTSFGSQPILPLWKSILADYACFFSFGLYRP